jgi:hypothetical protein
VFFFSDESSPYLYGKVNLQNRSYWSKENAVLLHEVSLHGEKLVFGVR